MNRRQFLCALGKTLGTAGISLPLLPGLGTAASIPGSSASLAESGSSRTRARNLILIELQGGNDGLNTVVPYADPAYAQLRPTIGFKRDRILQLDETTGLHTSLKPMMPLWERGDLAIVQGVGYPHPNRSHFRSIEIWETASESDQTLIDGWLKPVTDSLPTRHPDSIKALALAQDEGPLAGATQDTVVFTNLTDFVKQASQLEPLPSLQHNAALSHILAVENITRHAAQSFAQRLDAEQNKVQSSLPKSAAKLVKQMDLIARLIREDVGPQIYKVELGSFDTHANQLRRHASLMTQFAQAVAHLEQSLASSGHWQDVLVMTYSEFGRRASENGSGGTDHGTAAPHFVLGGGVRGGLYGEAPTLHNLAENDVTFTTDFRQIYSTVSRDWFGYALADSPYSEFATLPILKTL